jgi:hypothetical protein
MATFTITYSGSAYDESKKTEEVVADDYVDKRE